MERLGGPEVDDQLERGGLLDGDVGRSRALQDPIDEYRGTTPVRAEAGRVGKQASRLGEFSAGKDPGQPALLGEPDNTRQVVLKHAAGQREECVRVNGGGGTEGSLEIGGGPRLDRMNLHAQR